MILLLILPALLVAYLLGLWFVIWIKYCKIYMKDIPGPTPLPIIGNALQTGTRPEEILSKLQQIRNQYGPVAKLMMAYEPVLYISDYEWIKFICGSNTILKKIFSYRFLEGWLGNGLLLSTGPMWRSRRKLITPAFHFKILEQFMDVFEHVSDKFVVELKKHGDDAINVLDYTCLATLDAICETAMGFTVNALENQNCAYVKAVKKMTEIEVERAFSAMQQSKPLYYLTKNYYEEKRCLKVLREYTMSVIKKRKAEFDASAESSSIIHEDGTKQKYAFLDLLFKSSCNGTALSDEDICDEVNTFMFAGHDTISTAINFTLYCFSKYQSEQHKVFEEQKSIFGVNEKHRSTTTAELNEMKYLELFIKETLRLYPSAPVIGRELEEDTKFGGYTLPKGLNIVISIFNLHRDPEYYENPEHFDPERFLNDSIVKFPFRYIPFSAGPRNCIGQKYAIMELKIMLSKLIRHFEILPVEGFEPQLSSETVLNSKNGILVRFKERRW